MKITNKHNLPQPLVNVLENDTYSKGDARISVTGLLMPPRIAMLRKRHAHQIEADVSESIWAILGRAIHTVLEAGADEQHLSEERLFIDIDGWRVSGALDLQKRGNMVAITDYKFTSAYAVMNEKSDWAKQLNAYAHLVRKAKGWDVENLSICAIIRDWSRHRAANERDYPQSPVVRVPITVWPPDFAEGFMHGLVHKHRLALANEAMGEELPPCDDDDRWMRPTQYAAKKVGNKRARRVFEDEQQARDFAAINGLVVEVRPGEPIRCTGDYCKVSAWCAQFAQWKKERGQ
jgi:hypothetical protein